MLILQPVDRLLCMIEMVLSGSKTVLSDLNPASPIAATYQSTSSIIVDIVISLDIYKCFTEAVSHPN